jgi:hypothetical protein
MMHLPIRRSPRKQIMKTIFPALLLCLACGAASSAGAAGSHGSSTLSEASALAAGGSALVVVGSLSAVAASGVVIVESVEVVGGASMVVLAGASEAASATLRLSSDVVVGASLPAGTVVGLVAVSTGYLLVSAGKVLAFIPNEIGRGLLHQSRVGG